ncbi:hypothetical protein WI91_26625 [Burkholderia vietnamiensis]|uniref:Uncharacterized protein n=1 Tax=Burkholderia vietnamiensis TaxID=60552 RepID=A0AAW7T1Q6_BURVI|nr:hypothetical protein [Burkholderia vietnamiensis]KVD99984.1 hypothetical protein WI91_26625 [Burkholderia vietnamiensis]MCA8270093.1 hypothetical protein [Burkholderia vietnamiensis]MDN7796145.1 hypothetical protein [Burkholderia vietnamiensis]MDN8039625.1 hypothetical protein [Burkholderia vietnamiensis]UKV73720.1 hypothetical protein FOC29_14885 [Burkholderia vietnamiensis]
MRRHALRFAMLACAIGAAAPHGGACAAAALTVSARGLAGLANVAPSRADGPRGVRAKPAAASGVAVPAAGDYALLPIERRMRAFSLDAPDMPGVPGVPRAGHARRVAVPTRGAQDGARDDWPGLAPPWARSPW